MEKKWKRRRNSRKKKIVEIRKKTSPLSLCNKFQESFQSLFIEIINRNENDNPDYLIILKIFDYIKKIIKMIIGIINLNGKNI